jgi:hypothetical protein
MLNTTSDGNTERAQQYLKAGDVKPSVLLIDPAFSPAEKRWILEQRVLDLSAELRATEENMASDHPGVAGECLREAQRVLILLDERERSGGPG